MRAKTKKQIEAMGAGKGALFLHQIKAAALVRAGLATLGEVHLTAAEFQLAERARARAAFRDTVHAQAVASGALYPARDWSRGGAWEPVSVRRGARGGFDMSAAVPAWDRTRHDRAAAGYARALVSGRHVDLWARALAAFPYLGDGAEIAARRGGWLAAYEQARAERIAAAADELRAVSARRMSGDAAKLGTDGARNRRLYRVAESAIAPGPCADFFAPLRVVDWSRATRQWWLERSAIGPFTEAQQIKRAEHSRARALAPGVFALWRDVMGAADKRGRKWARGTHSSAKGASCRDEIGAAAAADDMGDFWERLTGEAVAIFRHAAAGRVSLLLAHLNARGVRVNRSARRALAWMPGSGADGRELAERWEYAAVKGRDGREVGGGFALQGAVHGLRDFAFSAPAEHSADDMGADEWAAALDAAAARCGLAPVGEAARAAELVREGYSPRLAAALAADEARGESDSGAAESAASVEVGALSWAPDAGAGSGLRPSVRAALGGLWAAIDSDMARATGTNPGAAARATGAASRAADLVGGLVEWATSGGAVSSDSVAAFLDGGSARAPLTERQRKALERLRKRYASHFEAGKAPARAIESRAASRAPSVAGDEIAGTLRGKHARRIARLVRQAARAAK